MPRFGHSLVALFLLLASCTKSGPPEVTVASAPAGGEIRSTPAHTEVVGTTVADSLVGVVLEASPRAKPELVAELFRADQPLRRHEIDRTPRRLLHFLSQTATETGGFRVLSENMNYSAEQMRKVFPKRVSAEEAVRLNRQPKSIANHVYNGRMQNRPQSDDGWNFRGSGYLQLTGRENFTIVGGRLKRPFAENPDLVRQPRDGLDAALEYWSWRGGNAAADTGTVRSVRQKVNGGDIGLDVATIWYAEMHKAYARRYPGLSPEAGGEDINEAAAAARILQDLGHLDPLAPESSDADQRAFVEALKAFQRSRKIAPSGRFDTATLYAITDPYGRFSPL